VLLCSRFIWFCTNTRPPWEADHAPSRSQSHRPAPRGPSPGQTHTTWAASSSRAHGDLAPPHCLPLPAAPRLRLASHASCRERRPWCVRSLLSPLPLFVMSYENLGAFPFCHPSWSGWIGVSWDLWRLRIR
jgi:hypothetical protein